MKYAENYVNIVKICQKHNIGIYFYIILLLTLAHDYYIWLFWSWRWRLFFYAIIEFCWRVFTLEIPWQFQLNLFPFTEEFRFRSRFTTFEMFTHHVWFHSGPPFGVYGPPWALPLHLYTSRTITQTIPQTHIQAACQLKPSYLIIASVADDLSNFPV